MRTIASQTSVVAMTSCTLIFLLLMMCHMTTVEGGSKEDMRTLLFSKLNDSSYTPRVRPVKDSGSELNVSIDMFLVAVNNVDEVEQMITSTSFMKITWLDMFMTWAPANFSGISSIEIPQDAIWKPDLALANAYATITGLGDPFIYLTITNDGQITWRPYQVFKSTCTLDMTYFPFDTQTCDIQLATWSSTKDQINIQPGEYGFNTDNFETNANWDLLSVSTFDSSDKKTSALSFRLVLKRKPVYFMVNFIIPIVLLSVLNTFVFALPCESGEKSGYAMVLFLSFAIFLLVITVVMPEGMTSIPVMSVYLLLECMISTVIVLITMIQLRLHNQGDDSPLNPPLKSFTKSIFNLKNKVLCSSNDDSRVRRTQSALNTDSRATSVMSVGREISTRRFTTTRSTRRLTPPTSPPPAYQEVASAQDAISQSVLVRQSNLRRVENTEEEQEKQSQYKCQSCLSIISSIFKTRTNVSQIEMSTLSKTSQKTAWTLANILGKNNKVEPDEFFADPPPMEAFYKKGMRDLSDDILSVPPVSTHMNHPIGIGLRSEGDPPMIVRSPIYAAEMQPDRSPTPTPSEPGPEPEQRPKEIDWPDFVLALDNLFFAIFFILNIIAIILAFAISGSG
ncbi:hypothetical protein DPMN_166134 [Dreissena polymorpha]|uniref:Uncharacterized protein n=2 Tax=Dreissena polymorpha TaxID=45954 RepID=A0A9D4F0Z3_DREPO|nr:hypothetical protein DPMN_166134 [Dreissena polymorpha]